MVKVSQRSKAPNTVTGPRVGAIVTQNSVIVRVLADGEAPSLPRATVKANDATKTAIKGAADIVAARLRAALRKPLPVYVRV
jgi:hypothetical protein